MNTITDWKVFCVQTFSKVVRNFESRGFETGQWTGPQHGFYPPHHTSILRLSYNERRQDSFKLAPVIVLWVLNNSFPATKSIKYLYVYYSKLYLLCLHLISLIVVAIITLTFFPILYNAVNIFPYFWKWQSNTNYYYYYYTTITFYLISCHVLVKKINN